MPLFQLPLLSLCLSLSLSHTHTLSLTLYLSLLHAQLIAFVRSLDILKLIGCQLLEKEYYKLKPLRVRVLDLSEADHFTDRVAEELLGEDTLISEAILVRCPQFTDKGLFKLSTKLKVSHSPTRSYRCIEDEFMNDANINRFFMLLVVNLR